MPDVSGRGSAAALRQRAALAIRARTPSLVSDLSSALSTGLTDALPAEARQAAAGLLVTLVVSALETGEINPRAGAIHDLQRLCEGPLGPRRLFHAVDRACTVITDELALDDRLGATSEPWPTIALFVRQAALDVLAAFTARLLDTPAHGGVRDPLTTLIARPVFDLALEQEIQRALRHRGTFALILFDVDHLSAINREHGYGVGDRVLERLGIVAKRFFRTHDWLGRHEEDSIVALLPETTLDQAAELATRFRDTVQQRLVLTDHKSEARATVTLSAAAIGVEKLEVPIEAGHVLAAAEAAVARAALNGGDRTERMPLTPAAR